MPNIVMKPAGDIVVGEFINGFGTIVKIDPQPGFRRRFTSRTRSDAIFPDAILLEVNVDFFKDVPKPEFKIGDRVEVVNSSLYATRVGIVIPNSGESNDPWDCYVLLDNTETDKKNRRIGVNFWDIKRTVEFYKTSFKDLVQIIANSASGFTNTTPHGDDYVIAELLMQIITGDKRFEMSPEKFAKKVSKLV